MCGRSIRSEPWRSWPASTGWFIFSGWRKRKAKYLFAPTMLPKPIARRRNPTSLQLDCNSLFRLSGRDALRPGRGRYRVGLFSPGV
jgi:hypothetical protein